MSLIIHNISGSSGLASIMTARSETVVFTLRRTTVVYPNFVRHGNTLKLAKRTKQRTQNAPQDKTKLKTSLLSDRVIEGWPLSLHLKNKFSQKFKLSTLPNADEKSGEVLQSRKITLLHHFPQQLQNKGPCFEMERKLPLKRIKCVIHILVQRNPDLRKIQDPKLILKDDFIHRFKSRNLPFSCRAKSIS